MSFLGLSGLLTGLWDLRDIQNSRQNRSKNKPVRENAVTRAHGSCSLPLMGSCLETTVYLSRFKGQVSCLTILKLRYVHTDVCSVIALIITRHTAAVVCGITNVQWFTELAASPLHK